VFNALKGVAECALASIRACASALKNVGYVGTSFQAFLSRVAMSQMSSGAFYAI
jgi:hypothetical protein